MKKRLRVLSAIVLVFAFAFSSNVFAQGLSVPSGNGAWGNMVYAGVGFTAPQPFFDQSNDMGLGIGVGLGDPSKNFGLQVGTNMLDVSEQNAFNLSAKVHKYFGGGVSVAVGAQNIYSFGSGRESDYGVSPYLSLSFAPQDQKFGYTLGYGLGRFLELSEIDAEMNGRSYGTALFGAVQYKVLTGDYNVKVVAEWNGINANAGVVFGTKLGPIPVGVVLSAADLTPYSGDGVRFLGGLGVAYQIGK